jgi:hypothetical protein
LLFEFELFIGELGQNLSNAILCTSRIQDSRL